MSDAAWNTETVKTRKPFEDFVKIVRPFMPSRSTEQTQFWFRGQRNATWPLQPGFARMLEKVELETDEIVDLEHDALREFQSKAHLFVDPSLLNKVKTTPCWWSVMQHHGAPTRLLDWSTSPYVAAYFAVNQHETGEDGALWCFCANALQNQFTQAHDPLPAFEDPTAPQAYDQKLEELQTTDAVLPISFNYATSERVVAQQGKFTMAFAPLMNHCARIERLEKKFLKKIIIPGSCKREILLRLRDINITAASLFPGVDGLGRSIQELIGLGPDYRLATKTQTHTHIQPNKDKPRHQTASA